ncbi:alpha/beta hydrolase [Nonomuraea sp. NPDC050310]|uniref:alpha/beta hydrolase n=1 Tax=Nonomuraea sp. NPDC050310 TaxID=3154935 RepID=UPI0034030312
MPLDPLLAPLLDALNARPVPAWRTVEERRALSRGGSGHPYQALVEAEPEIDGVYEETLAEGFSVRVYPGGPGLLLHFHGGGWWSGSAAESEWRCRAFAGRAGVTVVSADYRLAPEHPFPTPVEDCYRALEWAVGRFRPERIGVTGESAGGNLAAAVALLARDRNGPTLAVQVLEIAPFDLTWASPSIERYATGHLITAEDLYWCRAAYLGPHSPAHPLASPLHAPTLAGLPPALIVSAECDPLADDGRRYAERLVASRVKAEFRLFEGHVHGSQSLTALLPSAREWRDLVVGAVREHLG